MSTEIWRQDNHTLSVPQDGKHQAPCLCNTLATIQKKTKQKNLRNFWANQTVREQGDMERGPGAVDLRGAGSALLFDLGGGWQVCLLPLGWFVGFCAYHLCTFLNICYASV